MAVLIDTNIVLDWLLEREPFLQHAKDVLEPCLYGKLRGHLASHTLLNIFYITRKHKTVAERKEILLLLCEKFNVIGINKEMIATSLKNDDWDDLEDGLQMQCAEVGNLDCIITRDSKGFEASKVKVYSPESFLEILNQLIDLIKPPAMLGRVEQAEAGVKK